MHSSVKPSRQRDDPSEISSNNLSIRFRILADAVVRVDAAKNRIHKTHLQQCVIRRSVCGDYIAIISLENDANALSNTTIIHRSDGFR